MTNPLPTTTSISPSSKTVGDATFTMTVNGTNFVSNSVVNFNGSPRTTTFVSGTQLTASIPASDLTVANSFSITVVNPAPGGGTSNAQTFTVNPACTAASVATQPTNSTITYGSNTSFSATANGNPAPTLQWQISTNNGGSWSNISGATASPLSVTAPMVTQSGTQYRAIFTNTCGGTQTATSNAATLTVNQKTLTPNITAGNKVYDGNTSATILTRTLTGGIVGADDVTLTGGTATFDTKNVGTGKTVTATALSLSGTSAGNYVLSSTSATTTANITAKAASVTPNAASKTYGDI